ncbi:MAG: type II toxin-antitoxin system VapC family toxin [Candidatus Baltobacteraceae bacterium]
MKLLDVNLLLYAYDASSPLHDRARSWFESCMNDAEPVGFPLATLVAFVRLATDARIFERPFDSVSACALVDEWLSQPSANLILPSVRHWEILSKISVEAQVRGALLPDAHLAACAIENGATLYTHDRDFLRFQRLRVEFPLAK